MGTGTRYLSVLACMMMAASLAQAEITTVWNPAANPNYDPNTPYAFWTDVANWTGTVPAGGPNSNETGDSDFYKVVFNVANAKDCILDVKRTAGHLVMGDWGYGSVLRLVAGAELHAGCKTNLSSDNVWTGIGWGGDATLIIEEDAYMTTYDHLWVALPNNTNNPYYGTVIVDGGTLHVRQMFGLNWDNHANSFAQATVKSGLLRLNQFVNQSIRANSNLDIEKGRVVMSGDRTGAVNPMVADGRITAFKTAKFDKPGTVTVFRNYETDTTDLAAIHPVEPHPYFDETVVVGEIELQWNNWDPNHPGESVFVNVWFGTDPNAPQNLLVVSGEDVTNQPRSSVIVQVPAAGTYYWRVDTSNGAEAVHEGDLFSFEAVDYTAPVLTARSVVTTVDLLPATIPATVTGNTAPIAVVEFELMADDFEFPQGASAELMNITVDNQNPTATLTSNMPGLYKVKLVIFDGTTALERFVTVNVYDDACQAKKESPSGWAANYYDRNGDCVVNLVDFAMLVEEWLDDTSMQVQETRVQTSNASYLPKGVFDARIEGESVDPMAVSNAPVTDEDGIRIVNEAGATGGGQALGWTGTGAWAEYEINIPAAGVYDVYISSAGPDAFAVLGFGTEATPNLYGSVGPLPNYGGWGHYGVKKFEGVLSFDTAGMHTVRITWTNQANLDWFTLIQQ